MVKLSYADNMLQQVSALQNIASDSDKAWLAGFENDLQQGRMNTAVKRSVKVTAVCTGIIQLLALVSPLIGLAAGSLFGAATGLSVAAVFYFGSPLPAWAYLVFRISSYKQKLPPLKTLLLSLVAMNIPLIGGLTAFPLSLDYQSEGRLRAYRLIARKYVKAGWKERIIDAVVFGIS